MEFISDNLAWVLLALVSGALLLWPKLQRGIADTLTPQQAVMLINREQAQVLDVRDEAEFAAGHIGGARHIPLAQLDARLEELRGWQQKPIIVSCQSGVRALTACRQLKKAGFGRLYNLQGGVAAWQQANLPLRKG